jgi:hypothetical protein
VGLRWAAVYGRLDLVEKCTLRSVDITIATAPEGRELMACAQREYLDARDIIRINLGV